MFSPSRSIATTSDESASRTAFVDGQPENFATKPRLVGVVEAPHNRSQAFPIDVAIDGYQHRRVRTVPVHRLGTENRFWSFSQLLPESDTDLIHAVNTIPLNAKRFVVTFDNDPSRHLASASPWQVRLGQRILGSPSCKAILVRSQIAARVFRDRCRTLGLGDVASKIDVFGGIFDASEGAEIEIRTQRVALARRNNSDTFRLIFVGRDGLSLGLLPVLDAFDSLRAAGVNVELTIVTSFPESFSDRADDSALGRFTPSAESVRERIQSEPSIQLYNFGSRQRMRSLIAAHDLLLLPSLTPVSGWQIVDAALEGVPAIASNVFSLPELVRDGSTGIVIPLTIDRNGCWDGEALHKERKRDAIVQANHIIRDTISKSVAQLNSDRDRLNRMASSAAATMQSTVGLGVASRNLRQVYNHACH